MLVLVLRPMPGQCGRGNHSAAQANELAPSPSYSISDGRQPDGVKGTLVSEVKFLDRHETS